MAAWAIIKEDGQKTPVKEYPFLDSVVQDLWIFHRGHHIKSVKIYSVRVPVS